MMSTVAALRQLAVSWQLALGAERKSPSRSTPTATA
jgi:hypothetical protein